MLFKTSVKKTCCKPYQTLLMIDMRNLINENTDFCLFRFHLGRQSGRCSQVLHVFCCCWWWWLVYL